MTQIGTAVAPSHSIKETHSDFRLKCRSFVEKEILPFVHEWDESKTIPKEIYIKTYEAGILPGVVGKPWREELTDGIQPPPDFDYFHELILFDESVPDAFDFQGVLWGLLEGVHIGLPPVLNFGSEQELRRRAGEASFTGKEYYLLVHYRAVRRSQAMAKYYARRSRKTQLGDFTYIVTGEKRAGLRMVFGRIISPLRVRTGRREEVEWNFLARD